MPPTKAKSKKSSQYAIVKAAAQRHHVPVWLLWGIYGAENSWTLGNGVTFGLIEGGYPQLNGGKGRTFHDNTNLAEAADIAAELLATLKREHGSWAAAVVAYSGNSYTISHPRELARGSEGKSKKGVFVDAPFHIEGVPPFLDPGTIWEEAEGVVGGIGGLFGGAGEAGEGISELSKSVKAMGAFAFALAKLLFTPEGWAQLAKLGGGAILLLWGLRIVVRESTGSDPVRVASKVAATAAVVK